MLNPIAWASLAVAFAGASILAIDKFGIPKETPEPDGVFHISRRASEDSMLDEKEYKVSLHDFVTAQGCTLLSDSESGVS